MSLVVGSGGLVDDDAGLSSRRVVQHPYIIVSETHLTSIYRPWIASLRIGVQTRIVVTISVSSISRMEVTWSVNDPPYQHLC